MESEPTTGGRNGQYSLRSQNGVNGYQGGIAWVPAGQSAPGGIPGEETRHSASVVDGGLSNGGLPGAGVANAANVDRKSEAVLRDSLRADVSQLLSERQQLGPGPGDREKIRALIRERVAAYQRNAANANQPLLADPAGLERRLFDALLGLGRLQPLMDAPEIEEIICNGPARVFAVERGQKRLLKDIYFDDDRELRDLVKRLVGPLGKRLDESSPMVDARLPDGSRLNAAIPPATTSWTCLTIRKFVLRATRLDQLVQLGTLSSEVAQFLDASVQAGVNIVVSGPTGAGKTTLLNALGAAIASVQERVVTVEEVPELTLERQLPDCVGLQARPANLEGVGEIRIRDLVRNALRMRPTRIVVGECRGAETLDMILAMNTGHDGSLTTVHGNSPRDALERLGTLAMMAEERLTGEALARMIARTIELVIQLGFEPGTGRRRVVSVFEVTGLEGTTIAGNELWALDPESGGLQWSGIQPRCLAKVRGRGVVYAPPVSPPGGAARQHSGSRQAARDPYAVARPVAGTTGTTKPEEPDR
jgi:pilus assembly protein CpaF